MGPTKFLSPNQTLLPLVGSRNPFTWIISKNHSLFGLGLGIPEKFQRKLSCHIILAANVQFKQHQHNLHRELTFLKVKQTHSKLLIF